MESISGKENQGEGEREEGENEVTIHSFPVNDWKREKSEDVEGNWGEKSIVQSREISQERKCAQLLQSR